MFAQPTTDCNVPSVGSPVVSAQSLAEHLEELRQWISNAAREGVAAHEVERHLFRQMLNLGGRLMAEFLAQVGPGDLGQSFTLESGQVLQRWLEPRERRLVTVFGELTIERYVYGTRPTQKIELVPTDQRLQLPEGEVSYLLQEWDQLLDIDQAFGKAREMILTILDIKQSVDTLEHGNQQMAQSAPPFRAAQPPPDPTQDASLLVVSEDNKGVPMVRPADAHPGGAHRTKGQKANQKQMACIGVVYTVEPHVRTPEELVASLFGDPIPVSKPDCPRQRQGPQAVQKRYWAALSRAVETTLGEMMVRGQDEVFEHLRQEIERRRKPGQVMLHLCDGQTTLEEDRNKYLPRDEKTVDILDLLHVTPRLWEAAHVFHAEGSPEASAFVRQRLLRVLRGEAGYVVGGLRQMGTKQGLRGAKAKRLKRACDYLEKNLHRMKYDEYLKAGYPIASGVIEGACRHVIKDRMERAGMRWKVPGAQAMLELRTIHANGDWREFQDFRVRTETARLYPHASELEKVEWPIAA